jgi:hypothetical protein
MCDSAFYLYHCFKNSHGEQPGKYYFYRFHRLNKNLWMLLIGESVMSIAEVSAVSVPVGVSIAVAV